MQATKFIFGPRRADWESGQLEFDYSIQFSDAEQLEFTEKIQLPPHPQPFSSPEERGVLESILQNLSLILGVSYYKTYVPPEIELPFELTPAQVEFWNTVYRKGLGEFCYRNKLDPKMFFGFPANERSRENFAAPVTQVGQQNSTRLEASDKILLGIGGGKESIVAAELLKKEGMNVAGFVVETERGNEIIDEVTEILKIPVLKIRRTLDSKLFEKLPESYNGHVPVSAIYAWLGVLLAAQHGFHWVTVGNEYSSDFGNLAYQGEVINHQWSKSSEFERLFQDYVRQYVSEDTQYFSILRAFHEIRITKQLVNLPIWNEIKYKFSSCNRNFVHHSGWPAGRSFSGGWCGECPKCAFVFTMLSAFLPKEEVIKIFSKDLFADRSLDPLFKDLSGQGKMKPFDCVGTFDEMRAALGDQKLFSKTMRVQEAPTLPHRFFFAGIKKALILGYGREGKITEEFLKKYYPDIEIGIADQRDDPHYLEKQSSFDIAIKTPGLPKRLVTIPYTTATNIFFSRVKNLTIGVTGSKGKSTTASLIAAMLTAGGKKAELLGNIGRPMLGALLSPIDPETIFVLELSSQQLEDVQYSPTIAVITTLFPEHMDYHGSVEAYYEAKKNIYRFQKRGDVFLENRPEISVPDRDIPLLGEHNRQNIRAAMAVAQYLGIPDEAIGRAIRHFKPLPHRLEFVGEFRGITFYDNASSTTPESTIEALKTVPNIQTLFLGGLDRGYDFTILISEIKKRRIENIVLFPDTGARLKPLLPATIKTLETKSMKEAVKFAYAKTGAGKTVLLSAASPSYSLWANFNEQGDDFQKWVKTLA